MTTKQWLSTVTAGGDPKAPEITINTGDVDRMHDRILPEGMDVRGWRRNPVVLFGHDYSSIPVGRGTGIQRTGNGWKIRWQWLQGDPFAQRVENAWVQGMINASSVGVRPEKAVPNEFGGVDFVKTTLLEVSLVPIPANPAAVRGQSADAILRAIESGATARPFLSLTPGRNTLVPFGAGSPLDAAGRPAGPALRGTVPGERRSTSLRGILPGPEIDCGDLTNYGVRALVRNVVKQRLAALKAELRGGR